MKVLFSFEISKPQDIKNTLISTRKNIIDSGGIFFGNEEAGRFSGRGVEGIYHVGDSSIKISITKKPAIFPTSAVKSAIEDYFRE